MMDASPAAEQRAHGPRGTPASRHTLAKPDGNTYMTTTEVAALMRTSPETVRYWRHVGKGPRSFRAGRKVLYARVDVEAWIRVLRGAA